MATKSNSNNTAKKAAPISQATGIVIKSVTEQIKDVLLAYPLGTNVLKELLQNGDDAKARYMTYMLDLRTHKSSKIVKETLSGFQGPALLAFDSAVFPQQNFESMCRIADSAKKFDPTKTGKFGLGSYSSYQITDVLSFLSESFIRYVDPQGKVIATEQQQGSTFDMNEKSCHFTEDFSDSCSVFCPGFEWCPDKKFTFEKKHFFPGSTYRYPGTIIRLALRNEAQSRGSALSNQVIQPAKMEEILRNFSKEVTQLLLFLRHVEEIRILIWRKDAKEPEEILKVNIKAAVSSPDAAVALRSSRRAVNGFFETNLGVDPEEAEVTVRDAICQMMKKYQDKKLVEVPPSRAIHFNLEIFEGKKKGTLQRWVLSFHFADPDSLATQMSIDAVDPTNTLFYAKLKLIPWAMVAGLVEIDGQPAVLKEGRPYMTMPVGGLITKLPVHVNSCFEVGSSRQELFNTPNCAGADLSRYTWNHILVSELIPKAYVAMFDYLLHSDLQFNLYDLFPPPPENLNDIWSDVVGGQSSLNNHSFYHIYAQQPLLHPTGIISSSGKGFELYNIAECYFQDPLATDDVNNVLVQFLRYHGEKVVTPVSSSGQPIRHIYKEFKRCLVDTTVKSITPTVISDILLKTNKSAKKVGTMISSLSTCKTLLQYFLSTEHPFDWKKLNGIPLIPLKDGTLGAFEKRQSTVPTKKTFYIPTHDVEEEVFNYVKHLYADFDIPEMDKKLCLEANVEYVQLTEMSKLRAEFDTVLRSSKRIQAATKIWEYLVKELESLGAQNSSPRTSSPRTSSPRTTGVATGGRGMLIRKASYQNPTSSVTVLVNFHDWPLFFNRHDEPLLLTRKEFHKIIRIKNLEHDVEIIKTLEMIGCQILHPTIDHDLDFFHDIEEHYIHASSVRGVLDAVQKCELSDFGKLDAMRKKQLLGFFANGFYSLDTDDIEKLRTLPLFRLYTSRDENDTSAKFTTIDKKVSYITYIGDVKDVHPVLCPSSCCLTPLPDHKMAEIYRALGVTVYDNGDRILLDFGFDKFHLLKQESEKSEQIIKVLREITEKSEEFKKKLAATKFVPLCTFQSEGSSTTALVYRSLTIDPTNPQTWVIDPTRSNQIRNLFEFDTDPFFPRAPYLHHLDSLKALGLVSKLNRYGVINRAQFISKLHNLDHAKILSTRLMEYLRDNGTLFISTSDQGSTQQDMPIEMFRKALSTETWLVTELSENPFLIFQSSNEKGNNALAKQKVPQLQWAPLNSAKEMRPYSDYAAVSLTMPLLNRASEDVLNHPSIREFFNWDKPPPIAKVVSHLLKVKELYLKKAVEYRSNKKVSTNSLMTLSSKLDDLLRSSKGCYTILLSYVDTNVAELQAALVKEDWIFHNQHQQWVSPLNCAYNAKNEVPPFLCKLPSSFVEMRKLMDICGVREQFSPHSFAKCLADISKEHVSKPLTEELLGHVINALKEVVDAGKTSEHRDWWDGIKSTVMIPSSTMYMVTPQSGFYIDDKSLFDNYGAAGKTIIHSEVTVDITGALCVRPFSNSFASDDTEESPEEDVGQKVDLCAFLRTNLENYPRNSVLKEMLQNADDAGANSFVVLYDKRCHSTDKQVAYRVKDEDIKRDLLGPAILVQNDGVMKKEDIKAIQNISQSSKKGDHSKIGKFGLGFNSVYHITDTPSFLTGDSLYIFDPSMKYLQTDKFGRAKAGSTFNMSDKVPPELFLPYTSQNPADIFLAHYPQKFNGTLFRLPLRTTKQIQVSSLGRPEFTDRNVMELLNELRDNMANICLFLKNIRSIRILQWEAGQENPTLLCACNVTDSDNKKASLIPSILQKKQNDLYEHVKAGVVERSTWIREISITFDVSSPSNVFRYLMSARFGTNVEFQKMYDHMHNNQDRGFLPIAGIAALIGSTITAPLESYAKSVSGMTFCFLPLPIRTDFPVQINAYFAVTTDRQAINNKEEVYKTWNALLRDYVIAPLYAEMLLEARDKMKTEDYYKLFPKTVNVSGLDLYFETLAKETYKTIISPKHPYPTFRLKTEKLDWKKVEDVTFYSTPLDIHDVLVKDNFPLTFAPAFVFEECKAVDSSRVKNCTPFTVKDFYAKKWTAQFGKRMYGTVKEVSDHRIHALASKETVQQMLSYILLSDRNQFRDAASLSAILENTPFLVLASGDIGVFKQAAKPSYTAVMIPVSVMDVIPEALHRCVLKEDMGILEQNIANWNDRLNIPKLDLDLLAKLMSEGAPTILRNFRQQKLPFLDLARVPKDALPQLKNWLLKFYMFLSTQNPLNEQKFIELFESWPILMAKMHGGGGQMRLYTLENRKLVLTALNDGLSAQAAECFNILHTKLSCPVLVLDNIGTTTKQLTVVNQFLNSLVGQMKCLEVLRLIEQASGIEPRVVDRLTDLERDFLLKTCIDTRPNSNSDSAIFVSTIKKFPFFKRADGTYEPIGEKALYLLPSETLPISLEGNFLYSDERFNDFYIRDLKIKKLTLIDCYKAYILIPEKFDKFTDQYKVTVMMHVMDNQAQLLKDNSIIQAISTLKCIIIGDQWLRPVDCFDPSHYLFSCFFAHKCLPIDSPPYNTNTMGWRNFLGMVGLRKDLSPTNTSGILSSVKVMTAEDILLRVAQAIERATVSPKPSLVAGTLIGIRIKSTGIQKVSISKVENGLSYRSVSGNKYEQIKSSTIIAPWCDDAMCEPINDFHTISLSDERNTPMSVKGVFHFLAELSKAFVNKQLQGPFFQQLAKISCIPLLNESRRKTKAFSTPPEIANSIVWEMVPSCYTTYFGAVSKSNWHPMRHIWNGKFPLEMEVAMGMVTMVLTKDLLSHIKYLVKEDIRSICKLQKTEHGGATVYDTDISNNVFDNYKKILTELHKRDSEFAVIQKELVDVPFVWVNEQFSCRLFRVKDSFFNLKKAIGTQYFSHITPDIPYKSNPQTSGYACSIPENLAAVKPFFSKMGVRDQPAQSDLLGYLNSLKTDVANYTGEEIVLLSTLILKVLSVVAPNVRLSPEVFLPTDSKMSATSEDSYMFYFPDKSVKLLPAKELILLDDDNSYKSNSLLNFDLIHFFAYNDSFNMEDIKGVLPLLPLREVIQTKPTRIGAMVQSAFIARINELIKDPEFQCALFRLKFHELPTGEASKIRSTKWRLGDVRKIVQNWLPAEIVLNESIQVEHVLILNNSKVNITGDRFYKTDSLYISKEGRVRKNKGDNEDHSVKVDFFEFVNGARGTKATIPVQWKSSYESKFFITNIVPDGKSELVLFKPGNNGNFTESKVLCFVNPKMPCANTMRGFTKLDGYNRRTLHVLNDPDDSELLQRVSIVIDGTCLSCTKNPYPTFPGISFSEMKGRTMDIFRKLLMNPPEKFANILRGENIPHVDIHAQEPGDILSATEIMDLHIPQKSEEIRFFVNDIVAVKKKAESGQGDEYRYALVRVSEAVLTLLVRLEPDEITEEFGPAKFPIVFKLKKDIHAMRREIEKERFTAEVNVLCGRKIDDSNIAAITAFLSELDVLLTIGQDTSIMTPSQLKLLTDLKQAMEEKKKKLEEANLPPPPPKEDVKVANKGGETAKAGADGKDGVEKGDLGEKEGDGKVAGGSSRDGGAKGGDISNGKDGGKGGSKDAAPISDEDYDKLLRDAESGCHDTVRKAIEDVRKRKEDGEVIDDSQTCHRDEPDEHIIATNKTYHGIVFWISRDVIRSQTDKEARKLDQAAENFARMLLHIRDHAFQMTKVTAIKIFYDPQSESIAFNANATLFFNLHYWLMHKHCINTGDSLFFWFHTFCHEVAHNVVHEHGVGHNYALQCLATKKSVQLYAQKDKVKGK